MNIVIISAIVVLLLNLILYNLKYFRFFRRWYLKRTYRLILTDKYYYCCKAGFHSWFVPFIDIKEVRENNNSEFLIKYIKGKNLQQFEHQTLFLNKEDRLKFLQECIDKTYGHSKTNC